MKAPLRPQDLHRPVPNWLNLEDIFCLQGIRTVNNGDLIKRGEPNVCVDPTRIEIPTAEGDRPGVARWPTFDPI